MVIKYLVCFIAFLPAANSINAQSKAVVLQNSWNNELNNYNPKEFLDQLLEVLRIKLAAKELDGDAKTIIADKKGSNPDNYTKEQVKAAKAMAGNGYFIFLSNELRLPAFNLGKFLFRNPPRSSKLTFTLHVYDSAAVEIFGDTIVNRGCLVKTIDEKKGPKYFYTDYSDFMSDMHCHLAYIRKVVQEMSFPKRTFH
jgi:hypothetical protein